MIRSLILAIVLLTASLPAQAEERIQHYAVETPKNSVAALTMITEKIAAIETFEKQGKLESIHEQSYYLEAAVNVLRQNNYTPADALDALDEAVQTIHYDSENGKAKEVKAVLPKLKEAAQRVTAKR